MSQTKQIMRRCDMSCLIFYYSSERKAFGALPQRNRNTRRGGNSDIILACVKSERVLWSVGERERVMMMMCVC